MNTPVVLILFNRPHTLTRVWEVIRQVQPATLFLVADGPRTGFPTDGPRVAESRAIVENIDWPCRVIKHYSHANLGCRNNISGGLSRVFQEVEQAIVIEDDCVPDASFFAFCDDLLGRYRDESRVMSICGHQPYGYLVSESSYFFSRYTQLWGWATWRRSWHLYEQANCLQWDQMWDETAKAVEAEMHDPGAVRFWRYKPRTVTSSWGYQWIATHLLHQGLAAFPAVNLVSHISYGAEATHCKKKKPLAAVHQLPSPLIHPEQLILQREFELLVEKEHFKMSLLKHWARNLRDYVLRRR